MSLQKIINGEYIETDSKGGYALGNNLLLNQRRYHCLYTYAKNPPIKRLALIKSLDLRLIIDKEEIIFSSHAFKGKENPNNKEISEIKFSSFPIPTWHYLFKNGIELKHELFLNEDSLFLSWNLVNSSKYSKINLIVRPLFSGIDHHSLQKASKDDICVELVVSQNYTKFYLKENDISCNAYHNGDYSTKGFWYYNIFLEEEKNRGFDYLEDLYIPGDFTFDLSSNAVVNFNLCDDNISDIVTLHRKAKTKTIRERTSIEEKTRKHFIVEGSHGKTIIAGYPWFTDWGRDTFISLRGLCLAVNDFSTALDIILRWSNYISQGMIPNRFTDYEEAEYNSVDASLWFIICCYELIEKAKFENYKIPVEVNNKILHSIDLIIENYINGTRFNIVMDKLDGLIYQGIENKALTWMDARIDESPVTPRIGKAIEIQALWINALKISSILLGSRADLFIKAKKSLVEKFWIKEKNYFCDVINKDVKDFSFRPNQLYAVGGLPFKVLDKVKTKALLWQIEEKLLTSFGLRSLSEDSPNYKERCEGSHVERDLAYHQGTVWGFLIGPYLESYLRAYDFSKPAIKYAKDKLNKLDETFRFNSAGQCFEIYDGGKGNSKRGCPFQAWSFSEYLRIKKLIALK